nr:cold shock domain-containing protein [Burkholderia thailandensis]
MYFHWRNNWGCDGNPCGARLRAGEREYFSVSEPFGFVCPFLRNQDGGVPFLKENQRVSFEVKTCPKGKQAANIQAL